MGSIRNSRVFALVVCFLGVSSLIHGYREYETIKKPVRLAQALETIPGWTNAGNVSLEAKIVDSLELDDYIYKNFSNGKENVSLYIGYYQSSKKVGAAHSPLVCFPGQGWLLQGSEVRAVNVGPEKINLMRVEASTPQRKELLIFWYQAFERSSSIEFIQKLNSLWFKFTAGREENAFVRVTVPMDRRSAEEAYSVAISFINEFYPIFLNYARARA